MVKNGQLQSITVKNWGGGEGGGVTPISEHLPVLRALTDDPHQSMEAQKIAWGGEKQTNKVGDRHQNY